MGTRFVGLPANLNTLAFSPESLFTGVPQGPGMPTPAKAPSPMQMVGEALTSNSPNSPQVELKLKSPPPVKPQSQGGKQANQLRRTPSNQDILAATQAGPMPDRPNIEQMLNQYKDLAFKPNFPLPGGGAMVNPMQDQQALDALARMGETVTSQDVPTDFSALASLVDQWTGSNFAQTYKAPNQNQTAQAQKLIGAYTQQAQQMQDKQMDAIASAINMEMDMKNLELNRLRALQRSDPNKKYLNLNTIDDYTDGQNALTLLDDLETSLSLNEGITGPIASLGRFNPYSESQRALIAKINAVKQRIGTSLEGGVLRKEDENKYKKILPLISDTPKVAAEKIKNLRSMISGVLYRSITNYKRAGYEVSGFESDLAGYKELQKQNLTGGKQPVSANAPKVGTVKYGYKFKGGDPGDQNNWEKI
jgi:hypothetical protein